jgi:hypothetical protein
MWNITDALGGNVNMGFAAVYLDDNTVIIPWTKHAGFSKSYHITSLQPI